MADWSTFYYSDSCFRTVEPKLVKQLDEVLKNKQCCASLGKGEEIHIVVWVEVDRANSF